MPRCPTLDTLLWPTDPAAMAMAEDWVKSMTNQVLDFTWRGFDTLKKEYLHKIDFTQTIEQLERSLTSNHFVEIQKIWAKETNGDASFYPHHENPEMETRAAAPAKPPAYDLAFVWQANRRFIWPIEAKVLETPGTLAPYLSDVVKFEGGIAAPLINAGGLIAYLRTGTAVDFFAKLQPQLKKNLVASPAFPDRPHKISIHQRSKAPQISLHHMAMVLN